MIELRNVRKSFKALDVLEGVDLSVEKGGFISVRGKSGTGKTTLVRIVGLLDRPDSGLVSVFGRAAGQLDDGARSDLRLRKIGFVFQHHNLIPALTVLENVALPLSLEGIGEEERKGRARALLEYFDLGGYGDRRPESLSGGERQRVTLARALVNDPDLILADEPTASLDEANSRLVVDLLEEVNSGRGATVVVTTTDLSRELPADADYLLRDGNLDLRD